jgi:hypothetical protein
MSIYQIAGGAFFILSSLVFFGMSIPALVMGIVALVAGIALLAGK